MIFTVTIPEDGILIIKEGVEVDFKTPVFSQKKQKEIKIELSKVLNCKPQNIFKTLKKFVGEPVKKGEIIAVNKALLSSKKYRSEFDGVIKEINHHAGTMIIEIEEEEKDILFSNFKGTIDKIEDNKVSVNVNKIKKINVKDIQKSFGGEIYVAKEDVSRITSEDIHNKVILAEKISSYDQAKLEAIGAKGFVTVKSLSDKSDIPTAKFKDIESWNTAKTQIFSCCTIDKESSTMFLYE